MTTSQNMCSRSPHYLEKDDLLEKLIQIGYRDVAEILKDKEIDGEKLIKLREIDIVSWRLPMPRKRTLFNFIEKYKLNPSMLQIRSRPDLQLKPRNIPPRYQDKPAVLPKINVVHPRVKQLPSASEQRPHVIFPKLPLKIQVPRKCPSPEPSSAVLKSFQQDPSAPMENKDNAPMKLEKLKKNEPGYIDMTGTNPKPIIPNQLFTVNKRSDQNSLSLGKEKTSRSTSPSNFGQSTIDNRGGSKNNVETIRNELSRCLPKPPPIAPIKPLAKTTIASTSFVPPKKISANEIMDPEGEYEDMGPDSFLETTTTDTNHSKHFFSSASRSNKIQPSDLSLPITHSTGVQIKDHKDSIPVKKPPLPTPTANETIVTQELSSECYENLQSDEIYESVSETHGETRPNSYLDLEDVAAFTQPENPKEEPDNTCLYENVPNSKGQVEEENWKTFFFSKIFNKKRSVKSNRVLSPSVETYVNIPSSDTSKFKSNLDYSSRYRSRPLPKPPVSQPSTSSIPVRSDSGGKIAVDTDETLKEAKNGDASTPEQIKNATTHGLENSSKLRDNTTKAEAIPAPNRSCLALQLREKLAQLKSNINSPPTPTEDFSDDETDETDGLNPVHGYKENETKHYRKPNAFSYEMAFIKTRDTQTSQNVQSNDAIADGIEDEFDDDIYVEVASTITKDPFYRNITKNGAKKYLENSEDGAFVFIPSTSGNYFLVLAIKYAKKHYYMRLKKNRNNSFKLAGENCYPDFTTLTEFVEYFSKEPITIVSDGTFVDILLKPVLPKNCFLKKWHS